MKITFKTYKRLLRRMEFRIVVLKWINKRGHKPEETQRRIDRERKLARALYRHAKRNLDPYNHY